MDDIQQRYLQQMIDNEKEELAKSVELIQSFKKYVAELGLELLDENFKYYPTIGIVACYPNIITLLDQNLIVDKEGLHDFGQLCKSFERKIFADGYLYGKQFMLMAHPYFRRDLYHASGFAPRFVDIFWNYDHTNIDAYISIDPDRVRINVDNRMYKELDTWFGARFNNNIREIADGNVKLAPPSDLNAHDISFLFSDAHALDIKWSTKVDTSNNNFIKSFQAEEFKTDNITLFKDGTEFHPVRYVHAEYDLTMECFRHFDGAIHFYTADEYYRRRDSDFSYNAKHSSHIKPLSQKLFKMNGNIEVKTWVEFTSHFFTGNPLIFEYFEGDYPEQITEILEAIRLRSSQSD